MAIDWLLLLPSLNSFPLGQRTKSIWSIYLSHFIAYFHWVNWNVTTTTRIARPPNEKWIDTESDECILYWILLLNGEGSAPQRYWTNFSFFLFDQIRLLCQIEWNNRMRCKPTHNGMREKMKNDTTVGRCCCCCCCWTTCVSRFNTLDWSKCTRARVVSVHSRTTATDKRQRSLNRWRWRWWGRPWNTLLACACINSHLAPTNATKHDNSINGKTPKRIQIVENVCVPACAVAIWQLNSTVYVVRVDKRCLMRWHKKKWIKLKHVKWNDSRWWRDRIQKSTKKRSFAVSTIWATAWQVFLCIAIFRFLFLFRLLVVSRRIGGNLWLNYFTGSSIVICEYIWSLKRISHLPESLIPNAHKRFFACSSTIRMTMLMMMIAVMLCTWARGLRDSIVFFSDFQFFDFVPHKSKNTNETVLFENETYSTRLFLAFFRYIWFRCARKFRVARGMCA